MIACTVISNSSKPAIHISTSKEIKENENTSKKIQEIKEVKKNAVDNIRIMRNERKQLIKTLKDLEKTRSGKYLYTGIFSACSFSVKKISLEDGFCTSYGLESRTTCIR